ncbi:hypothetical protein JJ436_06190 [Klebsiella pneumoniae]|nr:hypothetical protein JJ436_06190 [Klebsiella pneumoniae]
MGNIKKYSIHMLLIILIALLLILVFSIKDGSIFLINSSFTDSVQAVSGVLSFLGGAAAVVVSIYISRKDTREKKNEEEIKKKKVLYYIYYMVRDLDDAFYQFERDFKDLIFDREVFISDSIYAHHYALLIKSANLLKEYSITDMPRYDILITFISIRGNVNKIIQFVDDFKGLHNEKLVYNDDFIMLQGHYQSDFVKMMQAIHEVKDDTQKIKECLGI